MVTVKLDVLVQGTLNSVTVVNVPKNVFFQSISNYAWDYYSICVK